MINDISKCNGELPTGKCPLREECKRYTIKAKAWQSYAPFEIDFKDGKCEHFIQNKKKDK